MILSSVHCACGDDKLSFMGPLESYSLSGQQWQYVIKKLNKNTWVVKHGPGIVKALFPMSTEKGEPTEELRSYNNLVAMTEEAAR